LATGGGDHSVRLYDVAARKEIRKMVRHTDAVTDVFFSADGKKLFSTSWDSRAIVWDVATGTAEHTIVGPTHFLRGVLFADGRRAATCGWGVQVWDVTTGKQLADIPLAETHELALSEKGVLAAGNWSGDVALWDTRTSKLIAREHFGAPDCHIYDLEFRADGALHFKPTNAAHVKWDMASNERKTLTDREELDGRAELEGALVDASGKFIIRTDGGGMSAVGFTPRGDGRIKLYDAQASRDLAALQKRIRAMRKPGE
jgi:hypothetical protein